MYKKLLKIFFVCCIMICTGCQSTPEVVEKRMSGYGSNGQIKSDDNNYCSLLELKNANLKDINVELDNMVLTEKIDFSQVESVEVLDMSFESGFTDNKEHIAGLFGVDADLLTADSFDMDTVDVQETDYMLPGFTYDDGDTYFTIEDDGFFSYFSGLSNRCSNGDAVQKRVLSVYDLDLEDVSGKKIQFDNNNEADIREMCNLAEKWLDDNISHNEYKCNVTNACVREIDDNGKLKCLLSLDIDVFYKGIRFNNYIGTGIDDDIMKYGMSIIYENNKDISCFSNGSGELKVDSSEVVENIISFESAVKIVNDKMSGFNNNKIAKIIPMYMLHCIDNHTGQYKVTARPVYSFIIKSGEDDSELFIEKGHMYDVVFVDMVTGDITVKIGGGK